MSSSSKDLHGKEQWLECPGCGQPFSGIGSLIKHRTKCFSKENLKHEEVKKPAMEKYEAVQPVCDLIVKAEFLADIDEDLDKTFSTDELDMESDDSSWQDVLCLNYQISNKQLEENMMELQKVS